MLMTDICGDYVSSILVTLPPREGGTPSNKPYRYVPPQRVWFLRRFGPKRLSTLPILAWNRVRFSRKLRECMNVFIFSNCK